MARLFIIHRANLTGGSNLFRSAGCRTYVKGIFRVEEMSDHGVSDLRNLPADSGKQYLLYGVLSGNKQSGDGGCQRSRINKNSICYCGGYRFCCICAKKVV